MNVDLSSEDLELFKMLLSMAEVSTRIEIHHAKIFAFKDMLKKREAHISGLIERIKAAMPAAGEAPPSAII
jgi:hypothetical protein